MRIAALLAALLPLTAAAENRTELLHDGGPAQNRINLAILGDGYTADEQDKLREDAVKLAEGLLDIEPYAAYASYFNVTLVYVESAESGADHPSRGISRDTAFDARYDCNGIQRLICVSPGKVLAVAAPAVPLLGYAIVLVNDDEYGGSGGSVPVVSRNSAAVAILQHELAHPLGPLADEYETPYPGFPPCSQVADCPEPNVTIRTVREQIPWSVWIDETTPVPTPTSVRNAVGLFEGARYMSAGVYRPRLNCAMRTLGAPFCEVCGEALITSVYDRVSPVDGAAPEGRVALGWNQRATLTVFHPQSAEGTVAVTWWRGEEPLDAASASLEVHGSLLGPGVSVIEARVADATPRVRQDPDGVLRAAATFEVDASAGWCGDGIVNGPERCDDGDVVNGCAADCLAGGGGGAGGEGGRGGDGGDRSEGGGGGESGGGGAGGSSDGGGSGGEAAGGAGGGDGSVPPPGPLPRVEGCTCGSRDAPAAWLLLVPLIVLRRRRPPDAERGG